MYTFQKIKFNFISSLLLFIFISAAEAQNHFTITVDEPVIKLGNEGEWDCRQVSHPRVIYNGSIYKMWYSGSNDTCRQIGYAYSNDGENWTKHPSNPVLRVGNRGSIDETVVSVGAVVYDGSQYVMFYTARSTSNPGSICRATSPDGIRWRKDEANNPIIKPSSEGKWDDYGVSAGPVIKQDAVWQMWYNGYTKDNKWHAGYAVSKDGIKWEKDKGNALMLKPGEAGAWDDLEQWVSDVIYDCNEYTMFYHGNEDNSAIGTAKSNLGMNWEKGSRYARINAKTAKGKFVPIFQTSFVKVGDEYKVYYSESLTKQIGLAEINSTKVSQLLTKLSSSADIINIAPKTENGMKVTYENGIKIVGEKSFDVGIKEGSSIKLVIYTVIKYLGKCAYIVSENQIMLISPNFEIQSAKTGTTVPKDKSKIFTHDGAIYVSFDGTLFATTSTTLLIINGKTDLQGQYSEYFKGFPPLFHPTIREGASPEYADLRDDTIAGSKLQISKNGEIMPKKDELVVW